MSHTDLLTALPRRRPEAESTVEHYASTGQSVSTTAISACELYRGAYLSNRREGEVKKVGGILRSVNLLTLTSESCETFGRLSPHPLMPMSKEGDAFALVGILAVIGLIALTQGQFQAALLKGEASCPLHRRQRSPR